MRIAIAFIICLITIANASTVSYTVYEQANCQGKTIENSTLTDGKCAPYNVTNDGKNETVYSKIIWGSTIQLVGHCSFANCTTCALVHNISNSGNAKTLCWNASSIEPEDPSSITFTYSSASIFSAIVLAISFLIFF
jgi:hypothetical protein